MLHKFVKGLFIVVGGIVVLVIVGVGIGLFLLFQAISPLRISNEESHAQLEVLRSDPMYNVRYPNVTELRRVERGAREGSILGGEEDPATVVYYAGTNDPDQDIVRFFITEATSHGWVIFKGPGHQASDEKVSVTFVKEGVGSLFVRLYDPERLNRNFRYEKLPVNGYSTILWVTLRMVSPPLSVSMFNAGL